MRASIQAMATGLVAAGAVSAQNYLGFNSGSTFPDNSAKFASDWEAEFTTAQNLVGAPGDFNAVRLYTNIQAYSTNTPIEAFQAAIKTNTKILLGVWASGTDNINNELTALEAAVKTYGTKFTDQVIGISIGSEDLYRISVTGLTNDPEGVGAGPDVIVGFINDFKKRFKGTALANTPVGHVDTWDSWSNGTNSAVIDAVDWVGFDTYPYYEGGKGNSIENAGSLFDAAWDATSAVVGGKPIWVTETGWPASGPDWDEAVCSVQNAQTYWRDIGCQRLFNQHPTFWYNLRDSNPANKQQFAITNNLSTTPLFDLKCPKRSTTSSSATPAPTNTNTNVSQPAGSATTTGTQTNPTSGSGVSTTDSTPAATETPGAAAGLRVPGIASAALALIAGGFAML